MSISDVRAKLPELIKKVSKYDSRVTITVGGKPMAVIVSAEELASWEETAEIMSIPGAKKSIVEGIKEAKEGKGTPLDKVLAEHEDNSD